MRGSGMGSRGGKVHMNSKGHLAYGVSHGPSTSHPGGGLKHPEHKLKFKSPMSGSFDARTPHGEYSLSREGGKTYLMYKSNSKPGIHVLSTHANHAEAKVAAGAHSARQMSRMK